MSYFPLYWKWWGYTVRLGHKIPLDWPCVYPTYPMQARAHAQHIPNTNTHAYLTCTQCKHVHMRNLAQPLTPNGESLLCMYSSIMNIQDKPARTRHPSVTNNPTLSSQGAIL